MNPFIAGTMIGTVFLPWTPAAAATPVEFHAFSIVIPTWVAVVALAAIIAFIVVIVRGMKR